MLEGKSVLVDLTECFVMTEKLEEIFRDDDRDVRGFILI